MFLFVLTVLAFVLIYTFVVWNNGYWKKHNVPHDPPHFFFGNFKDVMLSKIHPGERFANLYMKYKHLPYCGYFKLRSPGLLIIDTEMIKRVLVKDFNSFAKNDFEVDSGIDPIWESNTFMQSGERWRKTRTSWSANLTNVKIRALDEGMNEIGDVMLDYVTSHVKKTPMEGLEVRLLSSKFYTDAIVRSIFGIRVNSFENPNNAYIRIATGLFGDSIYDFIRGMTFVLAPKIGKLLKFRVVPKKIQKELIILAKEILENWKKNGYNKTNLLDSVVTYNKEDVSETEVAGIIMGFLLVGTETSATIGGFTLYSLAANPHVQNRLRAEIDKAYEGSEGGKLSFETVRSLPYLDMVLCETLRLYPSLLIAQKVCTNDYDFPPLVEGGKPLRVPKGMCVTIPTYGIQRDPDLFPDPEKFDPERFSEENRANMKKYSYIPFLEGPRMCLGMKLAQSQIKIEIAKLLRKFEVRLDQRMVGKPIVCEPTNFLIRNKDGIWLTFHERVAS